MKKVFGFLGKRGGFGWTVPCLILLLAGCGGGGSSSGDANPGRTPTTGSVVLSWSVPTSAESGQPFSDLAGYCVYYGNSPGDYSRAIDAGNVQTYTIENLSAGTYYLAVTAYDSAGYETDFSEEVRVGVP